MFRLRRLSPTQLQNCLAASVKDDPSYPEVGATVSGELPSGYRHDHDCRELVGPDAFERAAEGLRHWSAHEGAGIQIYPRRQRLEQEATILAIMSVGPAQMVAPCRIVRVIDTVDRFGFAYGTLPGHPECGEEAFLVESAGDLARFRIIAFSRPEDRLQRVSLGRWDDSSSAPSLNVI